MTRKEGRKKQVSNSGKKKTNLIKEPTKRKSYLFKKKNADKNTIFLQINKRQMDSVHEVTAKPKKCHFLNVFPNI